MILALLRTQGGFLITEHPSLELFTLCLTLSITPNDYVEVRLHNHEHGSNFSPTNHAVRLDLFLLQCTAKKLTLFLDKL